nr:flagellar filament capping protein FliD [uncultured Pseudomonas sp.]
MSTISSTSSTTASSTSGTIKSSTGLGTGLDITSLVDALVTAQTAGKQEQISNLKTSENARLSAVGSLTTALGDFQIAIGKLNSTTSFAGLTATSSESSYATATVDSTAVAGTYSLNVTNLATATKVATDSISSGTTFDSGTLTLGKGDSSYSISVSQGASLSNIRDSINKQSTTTGVSANLITGSDGKSQLVLSSTTTGASSGITLSGSSGLEALNIDSSSADSSTRKGVILTVGKDASYTLDGLSLTSSSNTIESAVSGVKFSLLKEGQTTVTVGTNTDTLKSNIQSFVDGYNALITSINGLTKVSTTTADDGSTSTSSAALASDSMTRGLVNKLQNTLFGNSSASGSLQTLSQLGITVTTTGTLSLDSTKLSSGLAANAGNVQNFFTSKTGLLNKLDDVVDVYTKSSTGLLSQQTSTIKSTLTSLTEQQATLDTRKAKLTDILTAKYNAMDTLVAQLNSTSSSVLTTLNALNKSSDD